MSEAIIRVREGNPLPKGVRLLTILQTLMVANQDGGTGSHLEYDILIDLCDEDKGPNL